MYERIIGWIVSCCPQPDKFAHTYAGLIIWLLAMVAIRRPRSILPLLVVLVAELANECVDRVAHSSWRWRDTLGDMAATWFWPTILTAVLRWVKPVRQGRASGTV
jgi:predicted metal-binding membrane protein